MAKEEIGKTAVGRTQLVYSVYDSNGIFGVEITKVQTETAAGTVSNSHAEAVKLANTLLRNLVFPDNLSEILEDYNLPE